MQWSAAYEDLVCLIGRVSVNSAYCLAQRLLVSAELGSDSIHVVTIKSDIEKLHCVRCALNMDKEWQTTPDAAILAKLVDELMKVARNASPTSPFKGTLQSLSTTLHEFRISDRGWYSSWGGNEDIWIIKPVGLSCGQQISCVRGLEGVLCGVKQLGYKCVVQKYIERPLLVRRGRKFDIRQWVLVTSVDPLIVYGFSECYLRLSSRPFSLDSRDLSNATVHLCNHAIQKLSIAEEGVIGDQVVPTAEGPQTADKVAAYDHGRLCDTMMSQGEFERELLDVGMDVRTFEDAILPQIRSIAVNAVDSVRDKVDRVGRGFEWLGLDLMVACTDRGSDQRSAMGSAPTPKVILLEVNVSPDISLSTPVTTRLVAPAVEDLLDLLIDEGALEDPVSAATRPVSTKRNHIEGRRLDDTCNLPSSWPSGAKPLQWNLWHVGSPRGKRDTLAFSRLKREVQQLGATTDYAPRKETAVHRVLEILKGTVEVPPLSGSPTIEDNEDEEEEEDEI